MQEQSFEQMLNESMKDIHPGEVITGKVISVSPSQVALNIGYKADGIIKRNDYCNDPDIDLTTVCHIGDELEVKVKKLNDGEGQVVLSRRELVEAQLNERLKQIYEEGGIHKGKVIKITQGGLVIEVEPMVNVFMPKSLVSNKMENDFDKYLNNELEFYITEFNPIKRRCIADRKKILVEQETKRKQEILSKIHEGDIIEGTIKSVVDYGVFVDIGGIDGLLHVSEMGWGKIKNPKKTYNVGDKIKVEVRELSKDKISLTAKFPEDNPWNKAKQELSIGKTVKGKIVRMTPYGAFVSLIDDIDGLLHVSEISRERVSKPEDVLSIGQEVEVKVIDFNEVEKRISLSMKALLPEEEKKEEEDVVDVDINSFVAENSTEDTNNN